MSDQFLTSCGVVSAVIIVLSLAPVPVAGQTAAAKTKAAKTWTPPRTPDGQPDLQGMWTNATITPFERPPAMAGKPFLTEQEAAALEQQDTDRRANADRAPRPGDVGSYNDFWYNNAYQILQTPGYVVILYEMIHEARIIPVDARPHLDKSIRLWTGDARGRWEGNTLVVETTNFNDKGWIATNAASARIRGVPHSDALRLVERFARVDADTISYEVTIEDPNVYTRPWTVAIPLSRDESYQMFEYACHEGNKAIEHVLSAARAEERRAAEAARKN